MSLTVIDHADLQEVAIVPESLIAQYASPETEIVLEDGISWVYYNGVKIVELGHKKGLPDIWVHPEPGYRVGRCKMIKTTGDRCANPVRPGWCICRYHGAGSRDAPGGVAPVTGKYSKHLPTRFIQNMDDFLQNPDFLSMRDEMALIDTRISEQLARLESSDSTVAWGKVKTATAMLKKKSEYDRELLNVYRILTAAIQAHNDDHEAWHEIIGLIDARRKTADTERRRIEAAQQYLTLPEANQMMAYVVEAVMEHVKDPQERSAISEALRIFAQK